MAHNQRPVFHKWSFFALRDKQDGLVAYKIPYMTCQVFFLVIGSDEGWRISIQSGHSVSKRTIL